MNLTLHPKKSDSFQVLLKFGKEILNICNKLGITPIVYGSLAYFYHTKDPNIEINDLDLLITESTFPRLMKLLEKDNSLTYELKPYHSIEIFRDGVEIDMDSIEHFLDTRSKESHTTFIENLEFHIINIDSLIDIYQEALDKMPKLKKLDKKRIIYTKKLINLKNKRENNPK